MKAPEEHLSKLGIALRCIVDPERAAILDERHRTVVNGQLYWTSDDARTAELRSNPAAYTGSLLDPVTGIAFEPTQGSPRRDVDGEILLFQGEESARQHDAARSGAE